MYYIDFHGTLYRMTKYCIGLSKAIYTNTPLHLFHSCLELRFLEGGEPYVTKPVDRWAHLASLEHFWFGRQLLEELAELEDAQSVTRSL